MTIEEVPFSFVFSLAFTEFVTVKLIDKLPGGAVTYENVSLVSVLYVKSVFTGVALPHF